MVINANNIRVDLLNKDLTDFITVIEPSKTLTSINDTDISVQCSFKKLQ